jgi:periplasmic divalent cation tolerance protein
MEQVLLIMTTLPDRESAGRLANGLVVARLAACVNVLSECTSTYQWKGAVENAVEVPILIKTRAALYADVQSYITSHHPYDLPEVIAWPVQHGLPTYLDWVRRETQSETV